jgi:hypothetical protein
MDVYFSFFFCLKSHVLVIFFPLYNTLSMVTYWVAFDQLEREYQTPGCVVRTEFTIKIERRGKCLEVALLVNINSNIIWNWKNN